MKTEYHNPGLRLISIRPAQVIALSLNGSTEDANAAAYLQNLEMEEEETDW